MISPEQNSPMYFIKNSSLNKEYLFSFDNNKDLKLEDKNIKLLELDSLNDNEKESNK